MIRTVDKISHCFDASAVESFQPVSGWRTCERRHSSGITGYQLLTIEESRDNRKYRKSAVGARDPVTRDLGYNAFQSSLRNARGGSTCGHAGVCKYDRTASAYRKKSAHDRSEETGSHGSCPSSMTSLHIISPIKVGRRFKHYRRSHSYIDQYR